jgi:ABC-type transporter Mla MlaB component
MRKASKLRGNRLVVEGKSGVDETRAMGMLRITIVETLTEQKWTLEGRLVQPWVSELKSCWTRTETARRERKCVVDLTGVTFIDKSGEKVLTELSKEGADLVATGVYTRHVVHNIERKKSRIVSCEQRSKSWIEKN